MPALPIYYMVNCPKDDKRVDTEIECSGCPLFEGTDRLDNKFVDCKFTGEE